MINALDKLPIELIDQIRPYLEGGYALLYIPKTNERKERKGTKDTKERNKQILIDSKNGVARKDIAKKYYLSIERVGEIIRRG